MMTSVASRGQLERADRADAAVDDGPRAQLVLAADDLGAHAQDRPALQARERADADGLGRVEQLRLGVVHGGGLRRDVPGAHGDLVRVHLAEVVVEAGDVGDVLAACDSRYSPVSRVDDADALAEVGEGHPARLHEEVVPGVAPAEHVLARRRSDGVLDDVRRDAHDACVSRSTLQPPSLKMSSASSASTNTPVRSRTSSVARWMSSSSDSVNTLTLSPRLRVPPACRFRFTPLLLVWIAECWRRAAPPMPTLPQH